MSRSLHDAIKGGNFVEVEIRLNMGEDINQSYPPKYQTPLHTAVEVNSLEMVQLLVGRGAELSLGDRTGNTPLSLAVRSDLGHLISLLSKEGARTSPLTCPQVLEREVGRPPPWSSQNPPTTELDIINGHKIQGLDENIQKNAEVREKVSFGVKRHTLGSWLLPDWARKGEKKEEKVTDKEEAVVDTNLNKREEREDDVDTNVLPNISNEDIATETSNKKMVNNAQPPVSDSWTNDIDIVDINEDQEEASKNEREDEKLNGKSVVSEKDKEKDSEDENKIKKMKTRIISILRRNKTKKGSGDVKDEGNPEEIDEIDDKGSAGTEDNITGKNKMKINKKKLLELFAKRVRSPRDCTAEGEKISRSQKIKTRFRKVFLSKDKKIPEESDVNVKDETESEK